MAEEILKRLRYSNKVIKDVVTLIREHMLELKMGPAGQRRLVARVGRRLILNCCRCAWQTSWLTASIKWFVLGRA